MDEPKIILRAYGIIIDDNGRVLVCDERIKGWCLTKFPGGGLEFGEGLVDCVKREFMEELALELSAVEHFYTTDFFQPSAFNAAHQIISVYYLVKPMQDAFIKTSEAAFDFPEGTDDALSARWVEWSDLHPDHVTLPIDKQVVEKITQYLRSHYA
jgi:ADP-ribose pyrophosphatase YjhB (NUDIX family)